MIDADTLALIEFEWPSELFYFGALAFAVCMVLVFGCLWTIERRIK